MYFRKYSKNESRWYFAGYSIVVENLAKKLRWNTDNSAKPRLLWRYGLNQYHACKYEQAIITFDRIEGLIADNKPLAKTINLSSFYQFWARCYMYLFLTGSPQQDKSNLEKAYEYYTKASKKIRQIESTIRVPVLLFETGRCLEFFGALDAAMDAYGKILAQHANFRGYFVTLFRTAVVGRYLASIATDAETKTDTIDKCIDILLFLLESPPPQIPDYHLVLTYARTLEISNDNQVKYRAMSVYHSFFQLCQKHQYANAHVITKVEDEKQWLVTPQTWMTLADMLEENYEYLIAREAFQKYIDEVSKTIPLNSNNLMSIFNIDTCLELANRFLKYSNIIEAIKFADYGLQMNHYHIETRKFLMKISEKHQQLFLRERQAVSILRGLWKFRCWNISYIKRLKEKTIEELEEQYAKNAYSLPIREKLAYYCKDKYRALFAFEDCCVLKIQHWWHRLIWKLQRQQQIRKKINLMASEMLHNYQISTTGKGLKKDPNILAKLKEDVIKISKHRFLGKKHPIHQCAQQIIKQSNAIWSIIRGIKSYQLRKNITKLVLERKQKQWIHFTKQVIKIQTQMRMYLSKKKVLLEKVRKLRKLRAVRKIQFLWSTYITTFTHVKHVRKTQKAKTNAKLILRKKFLPFVKLFLKNRKEQIKYLINKKEKLLQRAKDMKVSQEIILAAIKIQKLFRHNYEKSWIFICQKFLMERKKIQFSNQSNDAINQLIEEERSYHHHQKVLEREDYLYFNPGVSIKSEEFRSLMLKRMIICPHDQMDVMDYQLLATILTQTCCKTQILVLQGCKLFGQLVKPSSSDKNKEKDKEKEKDEGQRKSIKAANPTASIATAFNTSSIASLVPQLLKPSSPPISTTPARTSPSTTTRPSKLIRLQNPNSAENQREASLKLAAATHYFELCKQFFHQLKQCLSIRSLIIHGGVWSEDAIAYVFRLVQVHNPRIQSLFLENLHEKLLAPAVARGASLLLKDYFNYSIPGIRVLSLHGCHLRDEDMAVLSEGLAVNGSLEQLILSLNLLTDDAIIVLLQSLQSNQRHVLQFLDLQYNLIRCQTILRRVMSSYRARKITKNPLEIICRNNPILDGFDPIDYSVQTKIPPQFIIHYDEIALKKQLRERNALMQMYKDELQKPSARRQLLSVAKGLPDSVLPSTLQHTHHQQHHQKSQTAPNAENDRTNRLFSPQSFYSSSDVNVIYYQTENFLQDLETRVTTASHSHPAHPSIPQNKAAARKGKKGRKEGFAGITLPPLTSQSSLNRFDFLQAYGPSMKISHPPPLRMKSGNQEDILLSRSLKDFSTHRKYTY